MSILKKIAFQGEPGANSHEACRTYFPEYEAYPCATFQEAFEAIKTGVAQLGMIPIENSIAGRVADVHHLLPASGLKIIGERFKPIRFQLMANKGVKLSDIKVVASMPIALAQCRNSLRKLGVATEARATPPARPRPWP
jgi:prephenate dehydratase